MADSPPPDTLDGAPGIVRLTAWAELSRDGEAVTQARRAAATGDESWQEWVARADRGDAVTARVRTRAEFVVDGRRGHVEVANEGVWFERVRHAPELEEQLREIAYKDVGPLCSALGRHGLEVDPRDLEEMYFHIELAPELTAALVGAPRRPVGRMVA